MVDPEIIRTVRRYLSVLREHNIPATGAVVYGSHVRGTARLDSDIDVLVVSPAFDSDRWSCDQELWRLTLKVDTRIEPVPVGQRQLLEDQASPILEIARREGVAIDVDDLAAMPNEEGSQHTVSFLPWLKLPEAVEVGNVVFRPYPDRKDHFHFSGSFEAQLQRIFSGYVDVTGTPVSELTVVSFRDDPFKDLAGEEADRIGELVRLLAFSVMAGNDYYLQARDYFNATSFQHYHQRFHVGSVWVAPDTRRREGRTLHGGYKHGELKFTMPLQAVTLLKARPNQPFLQGLVNLFRSTTADAAATRQAIDWYFLANTDSDSVSSRTEVVIMASAFEALFQVQDERGKKEALLRLLPVLFAPCLAYEAERIVTDGRLEKKPWKIWWMDEFYWLRNKITHGGKIDPAKMLWTFDEHLTIAALILAISVKLKLAQLGLYTLTHEDQTRADSIDFFVADGNLSEDKLSTAQHRALSERTQQKVLEHLNKIMHDEPAP